jgi:hypothetical protein
MLRETLEQLFEFVAQHIPSEQIMMAKKEYQKTTGEIYEDDKSYNSRMALFLEWYLLDQYEPGTRQTVLENIIEDNSFSWTPDRLESYKDVSKNIQALFEIKKVRDNSVTVLDLFTDEKYQIEEEDSKLAFRKNDIFQGRIVPHNDKYFFTGYFCFHPNKTQLYIKGEAKKFYLLQRSWKKELTKLEKESSKFQKLYLKNAVSIEKIKTKIERTDSGTKRDKLTGKLLGLEEDKIKIEASSQQTGKEIGHLKAEKMKIEGRRLISELINKLAYMNLKWERSRQIDVSDIYRN